MLITTYITRFFVGNFFLLSNGWSYIDQNKHSDSMLTLQINLDEEFKVQIELVVCGPVYRLLYPYVSDQIILDIFHSRSIALK